MIACYIIYSNFLDKFYIGVTQENIELRIFKHNTKAYGVKFTSLTNDWALFHYIDCKSFAQAVNIERHIKRMKSRKFLEDLKRFPEMNLKLLSKYSCS